MVSNILGVVMLLMAISALTFAALTIYRLAKRRTAGWAKYALFISTAIGIASFIALGSIYEPTEKPEPPETHQEKTMPNSDTGSLSGEKAPETTGPSSTINGRQEVDPEPSNKPHGPEQTTGPDYDAMLEDLKGNIEASAAAAVKGKFDATVEPVIDFTPYTGFLLIKAQASDNLTATLIRKGIMADIRDCLEAIPLDAKGFEIPTGDKTLQIYALERIGFNISFQKADSYGRTQSIIILKAEYTKEELQKVDWANKLTVDFEKIADNFWYIDKE